ncbi:MAG: hypothetical protein GX971_07685 [Firmicutes bacterium]|nr:hypothetical protein [Bacillota bacterium]
MLRRKLAFVALVLCAFGFCGTVAQASGVITFQIEVLPGLTISSPDQLSFGGVAPGQTVEKELELTVWSNVKWKMLVKSIDHMSGWLRGTIDVQDFGGTWHELSTQMRPLLVDQDVTGPGGTDVQIPFRFTGSYDDTPGNYSFEVEFTVVPSL